MKRGMSLRVCLSMVVLVCSMISSGCDSITGLFSGSRGNAEIEKAYLDYRSAMISGDIQALRGLVVQEKVRELDAPEAGQMLALARAMYPANATVTGIAVQGGAATLTASAPGEGGTVEGTVHLLKEDNVWKVYDEKWEMKMSMAAPAQEPQQAAEPSLPQPGRPSAGDSSFSRQDPNVSGEAIVVKDGVTETYPLVTGFFSDTRFANPARASIEFQAPAPEHSNARRIEITLDATKSGEHFADGKLLSESFMGEEKVRIGEHVPQGYHASFRWVADGGQIFWPKTSCVITITSAYTGSASSVFSGEVHDCPVHSAGIDHTISSLTFTMRGAPAQ